MVTVYDFLMEKEGILTLLPLLLWSTRKVNNALNIILFMQGKGGLHKCTDCTNFQELMMTKLSKVEKTQVLAMRTDHLNLQT